MRFAPLASPLFLFLFLLLAASGWLGFPLGCTPSTLSRSEGAGKSPSLERLLAAPVPDWERSIPTLRLAPGDRFVVDLNEYFGGWIEELTLGEAVSADGDRLPRPLVAPVSPVAPRVPLDSLASHAPRAPRAPSSDPAAPVAEIDPDPEGLPSPRIRISHPATPATAPRADSPATPATAAPAVPEALAASNGPFAESLWFLPVAFVVEGTRFERALAVRLLPADPAATGTPMPRSLAGGPDAVGEFAPVPHALDSALTPADGGFAWVTHRSEDATERQDPPPEAARLRLLFGNEWIELRCAAADTVPDSTAAFSADSTTAAEPTEAAAAATTALEIETLAPGRYVIRGLRELAARRASDTPLRLFAPTRTGRWVESSFPFGGRPRPRFDPRDAVLYFALLDRMPNGRTENDAPLPDDSRMHPLDNWQGGDIEGLRQLLADGYFTRLGVEGLILSSPWRQTEEPLEFPGDTDNETKNETGRKSNGEEGEKTGGEEEGGEENREERGETGSKRNGETLRRAAPYRGLAPVTFAETDPRYGTREEWRETLAEARRTGIRVALEYAPWLLSETSPQAVESDEWRRIEPPGKQARPAADENPAAPAAPAGFAGFAAPAGFAGSRVGSSSDKSIPPSASAPAPSAPLRREVAASSLLRAAWDETPAGRAAMTGFGLWWVRGLPADGLFLHGSDQLSDAYRALLATRMREEIERPERRGLLILGEPLAPPMRRPAPGASPSRTMDGEIDTALSMAIHRTLAAGEGSMRALDDAVHEALSRMDHGSLRSVVSGSPDLPRLTSLAVAPSVPTRHATPPSSDETNVKDEAHRLTMGALFTLPFVPVLHYGDEIGLEGHAVPENRAPLPSPRRWSEAERRRYDRTAQLAHQRSRHSSLRRGDYRALHADENVWVFARAAWSEAVVVALNRGSEAIELGTRLPPNFAGARRLRPLDLDARSPDARSRPTRRSDGTTDEIEVAPDGTVRLPLPGRQLRLWRIE